MRALSRWFVAGMLLSGVSQAYYEKVTVTGTAKGYCDEKDEVILERAHADGMKKVGFTIGCSSWEDEIEEIGFPGCDYKKAASKRVCTVNPF